MNSIFRELNVTINRVDSPIIRTYLIAAENSLQRFVSAENLDKIKKDLEEFVNKLKDCKDKFELKSLITKLYFPF